MLSLANWQVVEDTFSGRSLMYMRNNGIKTEGTLEVTGVGTDE